MSRKALIDGDVLKYLAGFAVQKTIWSHAPTGQWFEGKEAANNWLKTTFGWKEGVPVRAWMKENWIDDDWSSEIEVEPWSNCEFIIEAKIGEIMNANKAEEFMFALTPSHTFRHDLAFTKGYKENRKDAPKPEYAGQIVDYLRDSYETITGDNIEADDVLGQLQTEQTVICSNDKDLKMIPGRHYDFTTGEKDFVDPFNADRWFYIQLLAGDPTDNIPGLPGIGMGKAEKIVDQFEDDTDEVVEQAREMYYDHYGEDGKAVLHEQAALVWILRQGETPETAGWRELLHAEAS